MFAEKTEEIKKKQKRLQSVKSELKKVIVGHEEVLELMLTSLLCNGNILLEGVPGLGKTRLVKSLGEVLDLNYSRIQFTPDLMPADIIGTNILMEENTGKRYFQFQEGPIFAQLVLADEINRATPKTQSALLEAMQEKKVTAGGKSRILKKPFFVLATQNPLEMEGTYPLPEAQVDRFFFKLKVDYPDKKELIDIINMTTMGNEAVVNKMINAEELIEIQQLVRELPCAKVVIDYAVNLVMATQPYQDKVPKSVARYVRYGSSPRGAQALILAGKARAFLKGRYNVSINDIKKVAKAALRHRILLNFEGEAAELKTEDIIENVITFLKE
ncbi:MAG: AAA family ATPase [Bacillota bacterium]